MGRTVLTPAGEAAKAAILLATPEDLDLLAATLFTRSARRTARLALRDRLLAFMAQGLSGDVEAVAEQVHAAISRYAASTWRFESTLDAPADKKRHGRVHRILRLSHGKVLGVESLRKIFAPELGVTTCHPNAVVGKISVGNSHDRRR